jgi:hypothetical protein
MLLSGSITDIVGNTDIDFGGGGNVEANSREFDLGDDYMEDLDEWQ